MHGQQSPKAWRPHRPTVSIHRVFRKWILDATINGYNSQKASTRYIVSGDYLSIKNITTHRLPATWSKRLTLGGIRLHAAIENVALFSKRKGLNPVQTFDGIVNNYTSIARVFSFESTLTYSLMKKKAIHEIPESLHRILPAPDAVVLLLRQRLSGYRPYQSGISHRFIQGWSVRSAVSGLEKLMKTTYPTNKLDGVSFNGEGSVKLMYAEYQGLTCIVPATISIRYSTGYSCHTYQ